ncbi:MAG: hypothetical protein VR64_21665 [Desulfatitalea sp. BRH_c12]|nr:MAG: hypothetical protein VR64_21665 [Desulfatitalea sp. BRH_c12]
MGKDSLIKSTAKKKGKESKKKSTQKAATGAQAKKELKTSVKPSRNSTTKPATPVTLKDLIFKQFPAQSQPIAQSPPAAQDFSRMTAPPLIDSDDPAESERLRRLLQQKFSMTDIQAAAVAPEEPIRETSVTPDEASETEQPSSAPTPQVSIKDLLLKRFPSQAPAPGQPSKGQDLSLMTAPPLIDSDDPAESERLRRLLQQKFNMADIQAAAVAPAEIIREQPEPAASVHVDTEPQTPAPVKEQIAPAPPIAPTTAEAKPTPTETAGPQAEDKRPPESREPESSQEQNAARDTAVSQGPPPPERPPVDPVMRAAKIAGVAIAVLLFMILYASVSNSHKYYVMPKKGSVEIWKGDFSPSGKQFLVVLHGVQPSEPLEEVYGRKDVFPMIFTYYLGKADALLNVTGLPDYQAIDDFLDRADRFALNDDMHTSVKTRQDNIARLSLLYKADVDASKGSAEALESALQNLQQAQALTDDPAQLALINDKISSVKAKQASLETQSDTSPAQEQK